MKTFNIHVTNTVIAIEADGFDVTVSGAITFYALDRYNYNKKITHSFNKDVWQEVWPVTK